jgi:hypothetical protein
VPVERAERAHEELADPARVDLACERLLEAGVDVPIGEQTLD